VGRGNDTGVSAPSPRARIRAKSIYDLPEPTDGSRVLATRYWPRGVPKAAADEYARALSPSEELLHSFREGRTDWWGFRKRYLEEMRSPEAQSEIRRLARQAATRPLTVMCVCKDATRCHRTLLAELIEKTSR
jgi:uncharacterized protein YeaO (DUF488 family)